MLSHTKDHFLLDPVFLFGDEATSRLDPVSQQGVVAILIEAVRNRGLALLIVTHEIARAKRVASRVIRIGPERALGEPAMLERGFAE